MQIVTLNASMYIQFEDADFKYVGKYQPHTKAVRCIKTMIAEEEWHYDEEDKVWMVVNSRDNREKIAEIKNVLEAELNPDDLIGEALTERN